MTLTQNSYNAFNAKAFSYDKHAIAQHEIGMRLFERLDYLKICPRYILDLGCGTGYFSLQLKKKYPKAHIVAIDMAPMMLAQACKKQSLWRKWSLVNADMMCLPFVNRCFDLVFSNQVIHWSLSLEQLLKELNRVMNIGGCLMFSTLGPDTFKELNDAWLKADNHAHVNVFPDMHEVGDKLLATRFLDPVVDMEKLTLHYTDLNTLLTSLKAQGTRNLNPKRNIGLTGRRAWQVFKDNYSATPEGKRPLTYEVVYGHGFKGMQEASGDIAIPISTIRR